MSSPFERINGYLSYINKIIVGQPDLTKKLMIALLSDGHLLVEGAPGLAKTTAIKVLSDGIEGNFHRVQFTPDLLPADLTGTEVYRPQDGTFHFQQGPLFHNLVLADEINRAPAKVQSALLEAMGERQITVGRVTYQLPKLFMVMATQNPIEQEGTYPLPEAQLDRFLMHLNIDYPDVEAEKKILRLVRAQESNQVVQVKSRPEVITEGDMFKARSEVLNMHMADSVENYIVQLIAASRTPDLYSQELARWINFGASPRGTIALDRCSRAHAWLDGRDYVGPEDVQVIAYDVLRHRILLTFEAEAEGISADDVIKLLIELVPAP